MSNNSNNLEAETVEAIKIYNVDLAGKRKVKNSPNGLLFYVLEKAGETGLSFKEIENKLTNSKKADKAYKAAEVIRIARLKEKGAPVTSRSKREFLLKRLKGTINYYLKATAKGELPEIITPIIINGKSKYRITEAGASK